MSSYILTQSERRYTTYEGRICNALDKARRLRHNAIRLSKYTYVVKSQREGHPAHVIEVTEHGLQCDCEAAQNDMPCCHAAAVALRLEREQRPVTRRIIVFGTGELFDEDGVLAFIAMSAPPKPRLSRLEEMFAA